jgi:hypothetical protein
MRIEHYAAIMELINHLKLVRTYKQIVYLKFFTLITKLNTKDNYNTFDLVEKKNNKVDYLTINTIVKYLDNEKFITNSKPQYNYDINNLQNYLFYIKSRFLKINNKINTINTLDVYSKNLTIKNFNDNLKILQIKYIVCIKNLIKFKIFKLKNNKKIEYEKIKLFKKIKNLNYFNSLIKKQIMYKENIINNLIQTIYTILNNEYFKTNDIKKILLKNLNMLFKANIYSELQKKIITLIFKIENKKSKLKIKKLLKNILNSALFLKSVNQYSTLKYKKVKITDLKLALIVARLNLNNLNNQIRKITNNKIKIENNLVLNKSILNKTTNLNIIQNNVKYALKNKLIKIQIYDYICKKNKIIQTSKQMNTNFELFAIKYKKLKKKIKN